MRDVDIILQENRTLDFRSRISDDYVYQMLSHLFKFILQCKMDNALDKIDYFLDNVDFQDATSQKILAVLRSTFSVKLLLNSWIPKYNLAKVILDSRDLNSKQLLRGLDIGNRNNVKNN